ncbi:membrane protease activity protein [Synechococcus phage S-CRES3]|nr:membrane protease activity protein [Synechococcus phage S-CRES3]
MALLDDLKQFSDVYRIADLERLASSELIEGDFSGSVTGKWVRLDQTGAGIVEYNSKQYATKPIGFTSVPAGTAVEMTYANGVYYSKW